MRHRRIRRNFDEPRPFNRDFLDFWRRRDQSNDRQRWNHPVTVCIAAICRTAEKQFVIIGASDRKVTAGDIEFEPDIQKIYPFAPHAPHIVALTAGDTTAQKEICDYTWLHRTQTVRDTVSAYCRELGQYNLRQSEQKVLAPLGFTMKSFLASQRRLAPSFVENITYEIQRNKAELETIICGLDGTSPQLYTVDEAGGSQLHTSLGFAAIGDGAWHAESQFMFAGYTPDLFLSRAMFITYLAKKRAEVAPGIGLKTDFFFIGDRGFCNFYEPVVSALETCYKALEEAQVRAVRESNVNLDNFLS